jgi:hypothetical protein
MQFEKIYGKPRKCLSILISFADEGLSPQDIAKKFNPIVKAEKEYAMCIAQLEKEGYVFEHWDDDALFYGDSAGDKVMAYHTIGITDKARQ